MKKFISADLKNEKDLESNVLNMSKETVFYEFEDVEKFRNFNKDSYTRGHCDRVSAYSVLIGKYLGLPSNQLDLLRVGGLFHDIGKSGIPDNILFKNNKLTDDEYSTMKTHSSIGANILSDSIIFKNLIPIVEHHHERYDGNGYPSRLSGENIPYLARITTVSDTFDAMTSNRVYRDALPLDIVIAEIEKCKGTQLDPHIADVFLDILHNHFDEIEDIRKKFPVEYN